MSHCVLVPGLFGCELVDAQRGVFWPPRFVPGGQPLLTDDLVKLMLSEATTIGSVIRTAECVGDVYGPVMDRVKAGVASFRAFAYDWRIDVRAAAQVLAADLAQTAPAGQPIVLIAHSMGGLVVRYLLECGAYVKQPWFKQVKTAIYVCAPHLGAPLALFRVLGLDGIPVILPDAAMAAIAADPARWPAGYQLLPAPDIDCVSRGPQTSLDVFAAFPALLPAGVAAVRALHAQLDKWAKPKGIIYKIAAAIGKATTTVSAIALDGAGPTVVHGDGDGTVPIWSADPTPQHALAQVAVDEVIRIMEDHVGILSNPRFLAQLDLWLDVVPETS